MIKHIVFVTLLVVVTGLVFALSATQDFPKVVPICVSLAIALFMHPKHI